MPYTHVERVHNKCLHKIMGYYWNDCVKPAITPRDCIVYKSELQLYRHVALLPRSQPCSLVVSVKDNPEWRRQRGCPQSSWIEQVNRFSHEVLRMGRGSAWRFAWRNSWIWLCRVGKAMCPPVYAPVDILNPLDENFWKGTRYQNHT